MSKLSTLEKGTKLQKDYQIFLVEANDIISFHDIPCFANDDFVNMVVEIPKDSNIKLESKNIPFSPIMYDIKNDEIRITNLRYPYNYGFIPQTLENTEIVDEFTNICGDGDPIDIFDISDIKCSTGQVIQVKILGCLAMIDDGQTDWKIIGVNIEDKKTYDHDDCFDAIKYFLKNYKNDKVILEFGEKVLDVDIAKKVIKNCHDEWCLDNQIF